MQDNFYLDGGALVGDPNNDQVFYSGGNSLSGSIYIMTVSKTTNGGTSWTRSYLTPTAGFSYAIAVDPSNSNIVYAGGDPTLYKSTNAGTSWFASGTGISGIVYDIKINPQNSSVIYVATTNSVYKSTDSGSSWTDIVLSNVSALVIDPSGPDTIYAGSRDGVYISTNGGGSWTPMNDGLGDTFIQAMGINSNAYIFAGTGEGAYRQNLNVAVREQHAVSDGQHEMAARYDVQQGRVIISYCVVSAGVVELNIYDSRGCLTAELLRTRQKAGFHESIWNGETASGQMVAQGVYFCRLVSKGRSQIAKIIIFR